MNESDLLLEELVVLFQARAVLNGIVGFVGAANVDAAGPDDRGDLGMLEGGNALGFTMLKACLLEKTHPHSQDGVRLR